MSACASISTEPCPALILIPAALAKSEILSSTLAKKPLPEKIWTLRSELISIFSLACATIPLSASRIIESLPSIAIKGVVSDAFQFGSSFFRDS